jgi:D-alanine--poly(phosphoribitol) ligase subunit 1
LGWFSDLYTERCHRGNTFHVHVVLTPGQASRHIVELVVKTEQMMGEQNRTTTGGTSILARFVRCSTQWPNNPAIVIDNRSYTYGELNNLCSGMCGILKAHDIKKGDRVGIFTEPNIYTYASLLAILSCGACYVPLNYDNPVERNMDVIAEAGIKVILYTDKEDKARELSVSRGTECWPVRSRETRNPGTLDPVEQTQGDLCYLLFTSGTTGKPKGVPIYHCNLSAFLHMMLESGKYDFNRNDRFLQMFELTFDLSVFSFLVPLSVGASFYPIPRKGMAYLEVADILATREITVALMVPSVINYLKPYFGEINLPKMRYSLFCGEALYHETLSSWAQCVPDAKIENLYGPTEATIFCLRYEWQRGESPHPEGKGVVPIGRPMEGMDAFKMTKGSLNEEGELCLNGEQVTRGYWHNPSKTEEVFGTTKNGTRFYRTGDLCKIDQAGNFLYLGRIDNQVKIDGHRVELEEIEFHARIFCGDKQVIAAVNSSEGGFYSIVLFIESEKGPNKGLREHLKKHLPDYMIPKEIITVSLFPLNTNGKTDRKVLINKYLQSPGMRSVA